MSKLRVIACIQAKNGESREVEKALRAMLAPTRQEAGCHKYELYRSESGDDFYFYEEWESAEALDAHNHTPHMKAMQKAIHERTAKPPVITRLRWDELKPE